MGWAAGLLQAGRGNAAPVFLVCTKHIDGDHKDKDNTVCVCLCPCMPHEHVIVTRISIINIKVEIEFNRLQLFQVIQGLLRKVVTRNPTLN